MCDKKIKEWQVFAFTVMYTQSRWKHPPYPPAGGGLTYAQGPHITYETFFLVF